MSPFGPALDVANAVLYEGFILYPYTASARKNRLRWQFGVVVPERYAQSGTGEQAEQQTEILVRRDAPDARVDVLLRFLQVEARRVEVPRANEPGAYDVVESFRHAAQTHVTFDEAIERELLVDIALGAGTRREVQIAFEPASRLDEVRDDDGRALARIARERWALRGTLSLEIESIEGERDDVVRLRAIVRNVSDVVEGARSEALRTSFVSTHLVLAGYGARFISALDAPPELTASVEALQNRNVFPVLIGDETTDAQHAALALASPIILYDFPAVAPQTEGDAFDATEIDELLTLSVLSLSDAEREEARATDPRARALVDRAERFTVEDIERLHDGALHRAAPTADRSTVYGSLLRRSSNGGEPPAYLGDPFAAVDVPSIDCVYVGGIKVAQGSQVRLSPKRRADVWDVFLKGKLATVRAVHQDFEDVMYVAVTVDEDPASDLHDWYGRSFFYYPDEIEPIVTEGAQSMNASVAT